MCGLGSETGTASPQAAGRPSSEVSLIKGIYYCEYTR